MSFFIHAGKNVYIYIYIYIYIYHGKTSIKYFCVLSSSVTNHFFLTLVSIKEIIKKYERKKNKYPRE